MVYMRWQLSFPQCAWLVARAKFQCWLRLTPPDKPEGLLEEERGQDALEGAVDNQHQRDLQCFINYRVCHQRLCYLCDLMYLEVA